MFRGIYDCDDLDDEGKYKCPLMRAQSSLEDKIGPSNDKKEDFIMKKCRYGANANCNYVGNSGCCNLPEDEGCINQLADEVNCCGVKTMDDKNKIKICCDEITLTKDSVGIEVNIQNLIQNIDKFETIEINGRVFKRIRKK